MFKEITFVIIIVNTIVDRNICYSMQQLLVIFNKIQQKTLN